MAAIVSPRRGVSFPSNLDEMVKSQSYNREDIVTSVIPLNRPNTKPISEEFKPRSILKISDSSPLIDHEMLKLIEKVESLVRIPLQRNYGAKTRNSLESFKGPVKPSFKPTLTTLSAFSEEQEI